MTLPFVVWDLDGTLVDSGADIARAANEACVALGLPVRPERQVRGFIGEGARVLMTRVLDDASDTALLDRALELFLQRYERCLLDTTQPYPGIDALVRALAGRQGIATNKPAHLSRRLVQALGWDALLRCHVAGGDVPKRKPAPDALLRALSLAGVSPEAAVFVGDTVIDEETAREAGVRFIAVGWGLRPRHELLGAPVVVETAQELEEALLCLGGGAC